MAERNGRETSTLYFHWYTRLMLLVALGTYFWLRAGSEGFLEGYLIIGPIAGYLLITMLVGMGKGARNPHFITLGVLCDALIFGLLSSYLQFSPSLLLFYALVVVSYSLVPIGTSLVYLTSLYVVGVALGFITHQQSDTLQLFDWTPADAIPAFITVALAISGIRLLRVNHSQLKAELDELQDSQSTLKLKNYQIAKYLPAPLREKLNRQKEVEKASQRKKLTVFFSDLVGFSQLSEEMEPNDLAKILDDYLTAMAEVADHYGGTVDKFIGDGIMIFFGDPKTRGTKEDAQACVAMAVEMRRRMNLLQIQWRQEGIDRQLAVRMGINSGFCTVGNFGSNDRMNYTALGTEVNLASRLESAAQPGEILVSSSAYLLVQEKWQCTSRGDIRVKGFADAIPVYAVSDKRADSDESVDYLNFSTSGFSIHMDMAAIKEYDRKKVLLAMQKTSEIIKRGFR